MNLSVLKEIKKKYEDFSEIIKFYRKAKLGTLLTDEIDAVKRLIEDLFVVEIFSCFERFLRNRIEDCLNLEKCSFGKEQVLKHVEYMKVEELLDSLKGVVDSNSIGYLKQLKQYRDWVAHGRNPEKPPPVRTVDFDKVFKILETVMEQLEKRE